MRLTTTGKIERIIKDGYLKTEHSKKINDFKNKERIYSEIYHDGKLKYLQRKIYELKSEGLKKGSFSPIWIRYGCPPVLSDNVFRGLLRYCQRIYARTLDQECWYLNKGWYKYKSEITLSDAFINTIFYIDSIVLGFFELVFKIQALEELIVEVDARPFLTADDIASLWSYTGVLWECPDIATLEKVFDFNNIQVQDFKIKRNQQLKFYKILRRLYNENVRKDDTQEKLLKPFLERYSLNWNTFSKRGQENEIL